MAATWNHVAKQHKVARMDNFRDKLTTARIADYISFATYVFTCFAGLIAILSLPVGLISVVGQPLVIVFGIIGFCGSILSMLSVLPKVQWLERVGLILLLTAIGMYSSMMLYLDGIPIALCLALALGSTFVKRLYEIR